MSTKRNRGPGDGLTWRDRATRVRKVAKVEADLKVAQSLLDNFARDDDFVNMSSELSAPKLCKTLPRHCESQDACGDFRLEVNGDALLCLRKR